MRSLFRLIVAVMLLAMAVVARGQESPGQTDLDKAFDAKLKAKGFRDLGEVIRLCESALQKGLEPGRQEFANQLLSSTLVQRGLFVANSIFESTAPDLNWPQFRDYALSDLEKAGKIDPKQAEAFYTIARLQLLPGGDKKRAKRALDQAVEGAADTPDIQAKALALRAGLLDDQDQRRADLNEAVRLAPSDPMAVLARGLFLADHGESEAALTDLDNAIELKPDHAPAYEAKALLLAKLKKYDQALVALDMAIELQPRDPQPRMEKARVLALQSNLDAALQELERTLEVSPDNTSALLLRSAVYEEKGDNEKARADVDRVLKQHPDMPLAVRLRTKLLAGEGRIETAVEELEKFRKEHPQDLPALLQLAMLYAAQQDYEGAIRTYGQVLAVEPANFLAYRGRADALLGLGRHAEAIADYERAFQIEPKEPGILNNFAWVLATSPDDKVRNGRRAVRMATEACKQTNYEQAHILSTLAAGYAESGDFASALKWSEKALATGSADQKEALAKELESYKAGKPWRERQLPEPRKTEKTDAPAPVQQSEAKPKKTEKKETATPAEKPEKKATSTPAAQPEKKAEKKDGSTPGKTPASSDTSSPSKPKSKPNSKPAQNQAKPDSQSKPVESKPSEPSTEKPADKPAKKSTKSKDEN